MDSFGLATSAIGGVKAVGSAKTVSTASNKGTGKPAGTPQASEGNANKGTSGIVDETTISWSLNDKGATINGRKYTVHALERMAPNIPEVRAKLFSRATKKAKELGIKPQTREYKRFMNNYVDPRNVPPMVIEDAIKNSKAILGNKEGVFIHETNGVRIVINEYGDVVTVIPK